MDGVVERQAKAIRKQFGARMRALRQSRGLSQDRFAPVCGLHRTYVGAVERGECNSAWSLSAGLPTRSRLPRQRCWSGPTTTLR